MNILILGGLGYIGYNTALQLRKKGHNIILVDNLSNPCILFEQNEFSLHLLDVKDMWNISNIMYSNNITHVIWCLELLDIFSIEYFNLHVIVLMELLHAMNKMNIKNFIYMSSNDVYGNRNKNNMLCNEGCTLQPFTIEGKVRSLAETMIQSIFKGNAYILRIGHIIGVNPEVNIGGYRFNLFNQLVLYNKQIIDTLFVCDIVQDYLHIMDLIDCIERCIERENGIVILNVGSGNKYADKKILDMFEKNNRIVVRQGSSNISFICKVSINKVNKLLNWRPRHQLESLLKI